MKLMRRGARQNGNDAPAICPNSRNRHLAVAELEQAHRFELASLPFEAPYWIQYTRGRAYLQSKEPDKAVTEFQKILGFRGRMPVVN